MCAAKRPGKDDKSKSRKQWDIKKLGKIKAAKISHAGADKLPDSDPEHRLDYKLAAGLLLAVMLVAFVPHAVSLTGGLVFNDKATLLGVPNYENPGFMWAHTLKATFTHILEQPWLAASYYLDGQKYVDRFEWWHLVNVSLHVMSAAYLYLLVFRVGWNLELQKRSRVNTYWLACVAAGIFACHPLVSQSVAYLSGRWAPLMTVNYLASLNFFLVGLLAQGLGARFWGYTSALIFALMALGSGVEAASLPLAAIALSLILKKPDLPTKTWLSQHKALFISLAASAIAFPLSLLAGAGVVYAYCPNAGGLPQPGAIAYIATQFKALLSYYARTTIVPFGLAIDPPLVRAESFADPLTLLGLAACAGCLWLWWQKRTNGILCLGFTLLFAGLLYHIAVPQPEVVADTVMYLPLGGLAVLAAYIPARIAVTNMKKASLILGLLLALLGGLTMVRDHEYRSELSLLESAVRANQASAFAHAKLALQLIRDDKPVTADSEAAQAYKLDNSLPVVLVARGQSDLAAGRYTQAKEMLSEAVPLCDKYKAPQDLLKLAHLGLAEAHLRLQESKKCLELATPYSQGDTRAAELCGLAYLQNKQYERALIFLSMVARQDPWRKECWEPIAQAALNLGMYRECLQAAKMAMESSPSNENRVLLAKAALACGQPDLALAPLSHIIDAHKADAEVYALMSYMEKVSGEAALSASYGKDALKLDAQALDKIKWLDGAQARMQESAEQENKH